MELLTKMSINKMRRIELLILAIFITITVTTITFYQNATRTEYTRLNKTPYNSRQYPSTQDSSYSKWPRFTFEESNISTECLRDTSLFSIGDFNKIFNEWSSHSDIECVNAYRLCTTIFKILTKKNTLIMNENFKLKVKKWLGNNQVFLDLAAKQVTIKVDSS